MLKFTSCPYLAEEIKKQTGIDITKPDTDARFFVTEIVENDNDNSIITEGYAIIITKELTSTMNFIVHGNKENSEKTCAINLTHQEKTKQPPAD